MEDSEQFAKMHRSFMEEFHYGISSILDNLKCEDLPEVIPVSSKSNKLELKKFFLELVVERYESEIVVLNSQEQSYQFRDPRAFLENIPPPKKGEISLPFDV